jgi:hypothetical protein
MFLFAQFMEQFYVNKCLGIMPKYHANTIASLNSLVDFKILQRHIVHEDFGPMWP